MYAIAYVNSAGHSGRNLFCSSPASASGDRSRSVSQACADATEQAELALGIDRDASAAAARARYRAQVAQGVIEEWRTRRGRCTAATTTGCQWSGDLHNAEEVRRDEVSIVS